MFKRILFVFLLNLAVELNKLLTVKTAILGKYSK